MASSQRKLRTQTPGEPVGVSEPAAAAASLPSGPPSQEGGSAATAAAFLPNGEARQELAIDPAVRNSSEETAASAKRSVSELPDQTEVDPAAIPYGQRVMSRQGWICSTQAPPQQVRR